MGGYSCTEPCNKQKYASLTYQWLANEVFEHFIGKNMEVFVNNMIVKNKEDAEHTVDLWEIFAPFIAMG